MKKIIRLTESQLNKLIEQAINELSSQTLMNAANKRHQQAMDYTRTANDATGSEKRRLEKWGSQPHGSLMQGRNGATYGGGHTPQSANSEENMKSAYNLRKYAQDQYKKENQTDKAPDSMYQWQESLVRAITKDAMKAIRESKVLNEGCLTEDCPVDQDTLNYWAELTDRNDHTQCNFLIAKHFNMPEYIKFFGNLLRVRDGQGYLDGHQAMKANRMYNEMMNEISQQYGEECATMIKRL